MNKEKELENLNKLATIISVNIAFSTFTTNVSPYFRAEALDWDDNEDTVIDSSPHREGLIGTFSSLNRQSTTRITHQSRSLLNDEGRCIKQYLERMHHT